jgi:hypothetical protein
MSKRKKKRSNFSLLRDYKSRQWRDSLFSIDNIFLKIKLACIIFWDFYDEENKKCPVYIKKLVRDYDLYNSNSFHLQYKEVDLYKELKRIGYPEKLSRKRSYNKDDL